MSGSYLKGFEEIVATDPESGSLFVEELKTISPDFAEYFVGFAFGKIHARNVLDPKVKELVAIASLIALGDGKSHLRLRILAAMRAGSSKEDIIEVIIQSIVYVGFTRAVVALNLVREAYSNYDGSTLEESAQQSASPLSRSGKDDKECGKRVPKTKTH